MNPYIKADGGNLVRIFEAIDGYRRKYKEFPGELILGEMIIYIFMNENITESGWKQINKFIKVKYVKEPQCIMTKGTNRKIYDYSKEGWSNTDSDIEPSRTIMGFKNVQTGI